MENCKINGWSFKRQEDQVICRYQVKEQLLKAAGEWAQAFPKEETWINSHYHVPSIIIGIDYVVRGGRVILMDIDENPANIGIACHIDPSFRRSLDNFKKAWPKFSLYGSEDDDGCWLQENGGQGLLLARKRCLNQEESKTLAGSSLSPIIFRGTRSFGEKLGLWKKVSRTDLDSLDWQIWENGFVLKPLRSERLSGLKIFLPNGKKKFGGTVSEANIKNTLDVAISMYLQPFIEPLENGLLKTVYRTYLGYDPGKKSYRIIGSIFLSSDNLRIHGGKDTVFGPLSIS